MDISPKNSNTHDPPDHLLLKNPAAMTYFLTLAVAVGMTVASVVGLLFQTAVYPTQELRQSFIPNDVVNLFIGLPILLGSMWLTRRGLLIGLLLWPGALLFVFYNYLAYVFGRPIDWLTLVNLALVLLSVITIFELLRNINIQAVGKQLSGKVPARTAGWISMVFGVAFIFRTLSIFFDASANQVELPPTEAGTLIADVALSIFLLVGGTLLIRRMPLGYVCGLGLLFATSMLFVGLVIFLLLRPFLTDVPFDLTEVVVVAAMGLASFVPFALYLRGAAQ